MSPGAHNAACFRTLKGNVCDVLLTYGTLMQFQCLCFIYCVEMRWALLRLNFPALNCSHTFMGSAVTSIPT